MKQMLHTKALITKANMEEPGVIKGIVGSSAVVDRMGDIIDQEGWNLKDYLNNKVILWGHNVREERPPIAKALKVWVEGKGTKHAKLMFDIKFDLQDSFAAEIYRKIKDGFLNTVSVGFLPHEWEELDPDNWFGGLKFTKQDLLELSVVPVPANPEALIQLNSMAKADKRFTPVEEKDVFGGQVEDNRYKKMMKESKAVTDEKVKEVSDKELINELRPVEDFEEGTFRALKLKKNGKEYVAIVGVLKETGAYAEQSLRFSKATFTEEEIKQDDPSEATETAEHEEADNTTETSEEETTEASENAEAQDHETEAGSEEAETEESAEQETTNEVAVDADEKEETEVTADEKETKTALKAILGQISKSGRVISAKNEAKLTQASGLIGEVLAELEKAEPVDEAVETDGEEANKNVVPFKSFGTCAVSEVFDAPGEVAKAPVADLKDMCAWFDADKAEDKSSYKLIHHRTSDKKAVWRGVASCMALLMGAKGGVTIPEADRKAVYDHLVKHYEEFEKDVPAFELVEKQVLASLDEEVHTLILDREEKHTVRLIKKILDNQKTEKKVEKPQVKTITKEQEIKALEIINLALSKVKIGKGGEN